MAYSINYASNNISAPRAVRGSITPGILPDKWVIEARTQATAVAATGDLVLTDDAGSVTLPDCRLAGVSYRSSGHLITVELWDRRYYWKFRKISGRYNYRKPDGTIDSGGQQSIRALATKCLDAAGEVSYDVSNLPTDFYPEVDWDNDVAMVCLHRLLTPLGYVVCWNPVPDTVTIYARSGGSALPSNDHVQSLSFSVTVGDRPSSIALSGARKVFQSKLKLVAVGKDTDGTIKLIDDLSYKPASGWTWQQGTQFDDVADEFDEESRRCALESVFKWYQAVSQADETQDVPGYGTVTNFSQILPLDRRLNDTFANDATGQSYQSAYIQGVFLSQQGNPPAVANTNEDELLELPFDLDGPLGLVKFDERVFKLSGSGIAGADLYLTCTYNVQDGTSHQFVRYERSLALSGAPSLSGAYPITHDELVERFTAVYNAVTPSAVDSVSNNTTATNTAADAILTKVAQSFGDVTGKVVGYRFLHDIRVNGKIAQVTWILGMATREPGSDQVREGGSNTIASEYIEFEAGVLRSGERDRILHVRHRAAHRTGASRRRRELWDRRA